jgi:hydroxymethylglutaryl-CoA lyase
MAFPDKVSIVEVGPRDGFQMETVFIPTQLKIQVINTVARAGIPKIEATSFVSPRVIPQMKDASEVMRGIERQPGVVSSALVPNLTGAKLAMESGADAMRVVVCASETYNQRNVRMSVAESLQSCDEILKVGQSSAVPVEVAIGLAFGCPLEGHIPEDRVVELTGRLTAMGYQEVSIADSVGLGNPVQVQQMMRRLRREFPQIHFSLHLHNTRGLGLANVLAALGEGIDTFDSSIGGLGGCPVVPGGSGNIPTEDLVNMLEEMGIQTGVDIEAVTVASRMVQEFLQRPLPSYILSAGTRGQLFRRVGALPNA